MPLAAALDVTRPAFLWTPPSAVGSLGDEAADLAESLEQEVREEERIALRALMPVKANGMPAGLEGAIICGRQQVKSWALEMSVIHDGWVTRVGRVIWTAHQTKTSDDNFEHLCMLVDAYDWLRKRVNKPYTGNGNHKIVFVDPQTTYPTLGNSGKQRPKRTIEFSARENGPTGRGRVKVNRLVLDEWLFGTSLMKGAFVPTMGASGDCYIRYGSSPGRLMSADLRKLRDRGRAGNDPSLSYCEWTAERVRWVVDSAGRPRMERVLPECADPGCSHEAGRVAGCFLDDPEVIRGANPAYGTSRLTVEFVAQERLSLDVLEYSRERAGIWEDPPNDEGGQDKIAPTAWARWADPDALIGARSPIAVGLDTSWDRGTTWAAVAGWRSDGVPHVQVAAAGNAFRVLAWVRAQCDERTVLAVGLQGTSAPVSGLADRMADVAGLRALTGQELAAACGALQDAVKDGPLSHPGQPELDDALPRAVVRSLGDQWLWDRKASPVDVAPWVAASQALHLLLTTEPPAKTIRSVPRRLR